MTATAHALIGGAVAASVGNPVVGISLSALSHPLVDMIPHWDFGLGWKEKTKLRLFLEASFDLILGVVISYLIFGHNVNTWYFLACVLASEIWDMAVAPYWFFNWRFFPFSTIYSLQHSIQGRAKLPWGILSQLATVSVIVVLLKAL